MPRRRLGGVVLAAVWTASKAFSGTQGSLATTRRPLQQQPGTHPPARGPQCPASRCHRRDARRGGAATAAAQRCAVRLAAGKNKNAADTSLFDQAFGLKLPWWDRDDDDGGSEEAASTAPPVRREKRPRSPRTGPKPRRVPRYPSALDADNAATTAPRSASVEEYVRSATGAARAMDAAATTNDSDARDGSGSRRKPSKLGILLIDHGSKRQASNDHLQSVAVAYQAAWDREHGISHNSTSARAAKVQVRAAHMEIAAPSILATLRQLIADDAATRVVCVPYFLSPGKHATIDVPHLINEARERLSEEGVLYRSGEDGRGKAEVEILSSEALGSNVASMLEVVDGLVRRTLPGDGEAGTGLGGSLALDVRAGDGGGGGDKRGDGNGGRNSRQHDEMVEELLKYTNRATLLEHTLQSKVQQLQTMTNRATLLEDVVSRMQDRGKQEQQERSDRQRDEQEVLVAQVANLTESITALRREKDALENDMAESLALQRMDMEKEYNTTIASLDATRSVLEKELQQGRCEEQLRTQQQDERHVALQREVERQEENIEQQQEQIQHLQTQLEYVLDANVELEQLLENTTEAIVQQYREQLEESREGHASSLASEEEETEKYRAKWREAQHKLEEEGVGLQHVLEDSTSKYEVLLEEERTRTDAWKGKWQLLNSTSFSTKTSTIDETVDASTLVDNKTQEEWEKLQHESEEAAVAQEEAANKVQALERQLVEQQQSQQQLKESMSSKKQREKQQKEQQEQLQEYLKAQIATYYGTIQTQTSHISQLECQITDLEQKQEESMLIATNSVEASQHRESQLLCNVEELESELVTVKKEREDRETWLEDLQGRLDRVEEDAQAAAAAASSTPNHREAGDVVETQPTATSSSLRALAQQNTELTARLATLEVKRNSEAQEKARVSRDKATLEEEIRRLAYVPRRLRALMPAAPSSVDGAAAAPAGQEPQKRRWPGRAWVRAALRPWTLLRKRRDADQ